MESPQILFFPPIQSMVCGGNVMSSMDPSLVSAEMDVHHVQFQFLIVCEAQGISLDVGEQSSVRPMDRKDGWMDGPMDVVSPLR